MPSKVETTADAELRRLEAALDAAIERAREAKQAVKAAKAEAKRAKKDRKRARRALIEAQAQAGVRDQEADAKSETRERDDDDVERQRQTTGARIAESPERRPARRSATTRRTKRGAVDGEIKNPSTAVATHAHDTSEPQAAEAKDTTKPDV